MSVTNGDHRGVADETKVEAYCFRCKTKREARNATETRMKNGRPALTGTCATCGTKMFKIGAAATQPHTVGDG